MIDVNIRSCCMLK